MKAKKAKVALNLRIPEEMKDAIDGFVNKYNSSQPDFPITRNDLATTFIKKGLKELRKFLATPRQT